MAKDGSRWNLTLGPEMFISDLSSRDLDKGAALPHSLHKLCNLLQNQMCVWRKHLLCKVFLRCFSTTQLQVLHLEWKTGWHFRKAFSVSSFHVTMSTTLCSGNLGRRKEKNKELLNNPGRSDLPNPDHRMVNFKPDLGYSRHCAAGCWISPRMEIPQPLWAPLSRPPSWWKISSLCPTWISHAWTCDDCPEPFHLWEEHLHYQPFQ